MVGGWWSGDRHVCSTRIKIETTNAIRLKWQNIRNGYSTEKRAVGD